MSTAAAEYIKHSGTSTSNFVSSSAAKSNKILNPASFKSPLADLSSSQKAGGLQQSKNALSHQY